MQARILHLTDTHLHANPDYVMMGRNTRLSLLALLEHIHAESEKPDIVLVTGDLTQDETSKGYRDLRAILETLKAPVYVLPGNHDIPKLMHRHMNKGQVSTQRQILVHSWQIVMLDSTIRQSDNGRLDDSQLQFLQHCLGQYPERYTVICLHHPPLPTGCTWLDTMQLENSTQFLDIIDKQPGVRAVLWGHIHQEFSAQLNNIQLLSTPSTFSQFKPHSSTYAVDEERNAGYRWLELSENGDLQTRVAWLPDQGLHR